MNLEQLKKFDLFSHMINARFEGEGGGEGGGEPAPAGGGGEPAPAATPTPEPPKSFINPDGTFVDGWQKEYVPEEFQGRPVFGKVGSIKDTLRQVGYLDSMVGKKGVIVPSEGSNPTEIAEFNKAIGVPESHQLYKYEPPEGLTLVDMSLEAVDPALQKLHEAGFTQKQVDAALGIHVGLIKELEASINQANEEAVRAAEQKIDERCGAAKKERMQLANVAIDKITEKWDPDRVAELFHPEDGLINQDAHAELKPYLLDFLAECGERMVEHKIVTDVEAGGLTPDQCEARILEIEGTPGFMSPDGNGRLMKDDGRMDEYKRLAAERDRMYRMKAAGTRQ